MPWVSRFPDTRLFAWRTRRFRGQTPELNPPPTVPSPPSADRTVFGIPVWRRVLLWPLVMLVRLWGMSLRFESGPEDVANMSKRDVPVAFVLWHNRLFLASEIHRRYRPTRPLYALISASKDGAWLEAFFSMVGGLRATRGSSSRLGREAASELVAAQREGNDIGITPDGPRGPCYDFKPGAVIVPRRTGAPVLLVGGDFTAAWRLGSWDRFYLPVPFSRVRVRCVRVENSELKDRDAAVARIQAQLVELNPDRGRPV
jgi:lysophospholipid acyltransferase (LPLAT)-like uncharacterized protein